MERPTRIQQLYGYSVCLVAIITALVTFPSVVDSIASRQAPLMAPRYGSESGTIGATYEGHVIANPGHRFVSRPGSFGEKAVYDTLSEEDARRRYDARRAERIATVRYETTRDLVGAISLLLVSLGLFVAHWAWLRRLSTEPAQSR